MSLPWIRLDTNIYTNHKVLELVGQKRHRAALTYILGLAYSGGHELDGFVPVTALMFIHGTAADAKHLVEVGLWQECKGGWAINGWDEFQVSTEEMKARRERAQKAANKRWQKDKP
jgi:hypothetical protein